ncbi:MAG TPA: hypothetical protein VFT71_06880 [Candidatus Nitrosocosmicus sp.]|nr:hypothetical protein [Candidatus Nitrosocosmicus sp.]
MDYIKIAKPKIDHDLENLTFLNYIDKWFSVQWCRYVISARGKMPSIIVVTLAKFFADHAL